MSTAPIQIDVPSETSARTRREANEYACHLTALNTDGAAFLVEGRRSR
ncbi:MAG: hypothetical protein KDA90_20450 [Planctomycetaceae bacterium]|nr:hypothetical protein [Planctomycetaceae bacterium]